jgi:anti-sigma factor RsiW
MSIWFVRHPAEHDLALFAGGELGPVARWRIEGHLGGCPACRQVVADFFEMRSRVMDLAEAPHLNWEALSNRIQQRAALERAEAPPAMVWRPAWSAAVALLLMVAAGLYVVQQNAGQRPVLDASANAVEWRLGTEQSFTLVNTTQAPDQVMWRVSSEGASARYLDQETGQITINHVYTH